jgi:hypothetical protein
MGLEEALRIGSFESGTFASEPVTGILTGRQAVRDRENFCFFDLLTPFSSS